MGSPTSPTPDPSEPPKEVMELLNAVDQGYIGHQPINKPVFEFTDESEPDYSPYDAGDY